MILINRFINIICAGIIFGTLVTMGYSFTTWEFWLIFLLTLIISFNSEYIGRKSIKDEFGLYPKK